MLRFCDICRDVTVFKVTALELCGRLVPWLVLVRPIEIWKFTSITVDFFLISRAQLLRTLFL